jgi:hypothetical protein
MLLGTKIPLRQAEPRLNARLERSNITMQQMPSSQLFRTVFYPHLTGDTPLLFTFMASDVIVQDRIYLGSPFVPCLRKRGKLY